MAQPAYAIIREIVVLLALVGTKALPQLNGRTIGP